MCERVRKSTLASEIIVATTTDYGDNAIADLCSDKKIPVLRGHPTDLLDRHYVAAKQFNADAVVKIPSDCPLISPSIIDKVLQTYIDKSPEIDFVSNLHPATYPDGNDVEVMPFSVLEVAWRESKKLFHREHTTPFIWDNPNRFTCHNVTWEKDVDYSMSHRWVLDYPEDYDFIKAVFEELYPTNPDFEIDDILTLLQQKPSIHEINLMHAGVNWYRHHLDELQTVSKDQTVERK
jgi:spore coat polysaccharide biosynthesis protein SpsF